MKSNRAKVIISVASAIAVFVILSSMVQAAGAYTSFKCAKAFCQSYDGRGQPRYITTRVGIKLPAGVIVGSTIEGSKVSVSWIEQRGFRTNSGIFYKTADFK